MTMVIKYLNTFEEMSVFF